MYFTETTSAGRQAGGATQWNFKVDGEQIGFAIGGISTGTLTVSART